MNGPLAQLFATIPLGNSFGVDDAIVIAAAAHANQRDKGRPSLPYVTHPIRVMAQFDDPVLQVIGVLHDVVEDTDVSLEDLEAAGAGERVLAAVDALTKREGEERSEYLVRLRANPDALAVKLEDHADNADEDRLALLPAAAGDRLRQKYAADKKLLGITE